jgi:hypothetical protein
MDLDSSCSPVLDQVAKVGSSSRPLDRAFDATLPTGPLNEREAFGSVAYDEPGIIGPERGGFPECGAFPTKSSI